MRLKTRRAVQPAWTGGIAEDASGQAAFDENGVLAGRFDAAQNFVMTNTGLLEVRGGAEHAITLDDGTGPPANPFTSAWGFFYTVRGIFLIGHDAANSKHYQQQWDAEGATLANQTDVGATATSWDSASPGRALAVELWEKMWVADATRDAASRRSLFSVDSTGVVAEPTFAFEGGAAQALTPYCIETHNGVLLIAGYGSEAGADDPALLRHSFLGKDPGAADGFEPLSWVLVGSKGQPITALKAGDEYTLIAKEHELYRLSGYGRALEGFQYAIERLSTTMAVGCTNPHAITFAEGLWYGVGSSGPWLSDGQSVTLLAGPRARSWRSIANSVRDRAYVAYHPERRKVLFGFGTVQWVFDTARQVWDSDWTTRDFNNVVAVVGADISAPVAAPSGLAVDHPSATTSSIAVSWTNGDPAAQTEIWVDEMTGSGFLLKGTAVPGATSGSATSLRVATHSLVKVCHIKGGVRSTFSDTVDAYTRLEEPVLTLERATCTHKGPTQGVVTVLATLAVGGHHLHIVGDSGTYLDLNPAAAGAHFGEELTPCCIVEAIEAWTTDASWPAAINESTHDTLDVDVPC